MSVLLRHMSAAKATGAVNPLGDADRALAAKLADSAKTMRERLATRVFGQARAIDLLLTAFFGGGHVLLLGVPGLAKTLLVRSLADLLGMSFSRIQFTPDLMPTDITGGVLIQDNADTGERSLNFSKGPVFCNVLLADEINRTPPKTQAALLEAMEERTVTVGNEHHPLPLPFFVLATQNPIDQEGTYALPISARDRFMFEILIDYPAKDTEAKIARITTSRGEAPLTPVLSAQEVREYLNLVRRVPVPEYLMLVARDLVRATRLKSEVAPTFVEEWIEWGASPRGSIEMVLAAKAHAVLSGRLEVAVEDIRAVAPSILRHRIVTNYSASSEWGFIERLVDAVIEEIMPSPKVRKSFFARFFERLLGTG